MAERSKAPVQLADGCGFETQSGRRVRAEKSGRSGSLGGWGGKFRGLPGAVRTSRLAKKIENKTQGIFFHAAFDFDAPGPRNTTQK